MKYKIGDHVRIKSLDWYNENKDEDGIVEEETKVGTALNPIELKPNANCITRERIDELATKIDKEVPSGNQTVWELPDGYQFVDENGNVINATTIALEKKKKEYPKTYEECYKIMGVKLSDCYIQGYKSPLLEDLQELLICRDAYWKIAGDEMGLGKPWEPDYDSGVDKFGIVYFDNTIMRTGALHRWERHLNKVLEFPTEEMRDAFYENFKKEIEMCKELL